MNQNVQFLDDEFLDCERQAVVFSALQSGFKRMCAISLQEMEHRFGPGPALDLFKQHRWDIEEDAEQIINAQQDDSQGYYWLSSI